MRFLQADVEVLEARYFVGMGNDIWGARGAWIRVVSLIRQDADAGGLNEGLGKEGADVCQSIRESGFYEGVASCCNGLFVATKRSQ